MQIHLVIKNDQTNVGNIGPIYGAFSSIEKATEEVAKHEVDTIAIMTLEVDALVTPKENQ